MGGSRGNETVNKDEKDVAVKQNVETDKALESEESENVEEKLLAEIASLKDTLIRKAADLENLRKRMEREKIDAIRFANTSLVRDLLPTIDNFEHIVANMPCKGAVNENVQAVLDGILLCQKMMLDALRKQGVSKVEVKSGDSFDHRYHQAMCEVESEDMAPGKVVAVMQNGYLYHDRLIRPSMVSVAKK